MVIQVDELKLDLADAERLFFSASRPNIKSYLEKEVKRLRQELQAAEKLAKAASSEPSSKRFVSELTNYAFDQSDKFVKIFVTLDGIEKITDPEANVQITFTERSLQLRILNFKDRDYTFVVNSLLEPIDVSKSYRKVKSDMVGIYLKKTKEGSKWSHLTSTEKLLKEKKDAAFKDEGDVDPGDPQAGLMNMMKKLYNTGDPEMKRMIAKTWTEGNEKRGMGGDMGMNMMPEL